MPFAISPHHNLDDFPNGLTLDQKIEVFIDRVEGWMLGPAKEMVTKGLGYRGFALLSIVTSYFEMIAKYTEGFAQKGKSAHYFEKGLQMVFPEMALPDAKDLLDSLYERVRNGMYHVGMTKPNVVLVDPSFGRGSIGFNSPTGAIVIAPDTLVDDLTIHFRSFAKQLRDPNQQTFRTDFEERFDFDNT